MRKPHVIWAFVPVLAFLSTPFLPFVNGPHLWFGVPSVLAWCLLWTAGTTASLALVEHFSRTDNERADREEAEEAAA
ncbi:MULTISPECIES: hypothetical protein [unclassified Streptomyces]|uniref:DUF3311 domain-containing protein n=1 Tax=Streptomyces sp. NBC_00119 TaxID=2975659 RepID=A0AAU1U5W0_9ACTN|nr:MULTISPECIES: hypothetical protein [unclassified Streptomyces]MCX4643427.1 hypothetical protein [Streptomyces sp. NBC_01446]MCX5324550.1 hypothetical protein [Streptomyces sp. NBC_00120]